MKEECLSRLILFGGGSLARALKEYVEHYHSERNHKGRENRVLSASVRDLGVRPVPYRLSIENTEDSHEHQNHAT